MQDEIDTLVKKYGNPPITAQTQDALIIYLNEQYSLYISESLLCVGLVYGNLDMDNITLRYFSSVVEWIQTVESFLRFFDFTINSPYKSLDR